MKSVLITGGAGFIGSNYIKYVLEKYENYRFVNVDALTYAGNLENLKEIQDDERYTFMNINICDREALFDLFSKYGFDYVRTEK